MIHCVNPPPEHEEKRIKKEEITSEVGTKKREARSASIQRFLFPSFCGSLPLPSINSVGNFAT